MQQARAAARAAAGAIRTELPTIPEGSVTAEGGGDADRPRQQPAEANAAARQEEVEAVAGERAAEMRSSKLEAGMCYLSYLSPCFLGELEHDLHRIFVAFVAVIAHLGCTR